MSGGVKYVSGAKTLAWIPAVENKLVSMALSGWYR